MQSLSNLAKKSRKQYAGLNILLRYAYLTETYDIGIILGHFYTGYGITSRQKKRMQKGLELLKAARIASLMTTGGKGLWKKSAPSMGEAAKAYFIAHGVEPSQILVEDQSGNTIQNAQYALRLMQQRQLTSAIVVTSADHMPRAKLVFAEIFPSSYALDFVVSDTFCGFWSIFDFFWNTAGNLKRFLNKVNILTISK